jgi:hypothetical protein
VLPSPPKPEKLGLAHVERRRHQYANATTHDLVQLREQGLDRPSDRRVDHDRVLAVSQHVASHRRGHASTREGEAPKPRATSAKADTAAILAAGPAGRPSSLGRIVTLDARAGRESASMPAAGARRGGVNANGGSRSAVSYAMWLRREQRDGETGDSWRSGRFSAPMVAACPAVDDAAILVAIVLLAFALHNAIVGVVVAVAHLLFRFGFSYWARRNRARVRERLRTDPAYWSGAHESSGFSAGTSSCYSPSSPLFSSHS